MGGNNAGEQWRAGRTILIRVHAYGAHGERLAKTLEDRRLLIAAELQVEGQ